MLSREIAEDIVRETMNRLERNINIMDESGTIIASGDPARINRFHEASLYVIQTGKPLIIDKNHENQWKGTMPGINLPIEFQGRIVGVIGITGEPEDVEEFGGLVKMATELMIRQTYLASQEEWKQRIKELIFEEVIKPDANLELARQRLNMLQLKLTPPFHISVVQMKERNIPNQDIIRKVEQIISEGEVLAGFHRVNRMFIVASGISEVKIKQKLQILQNQLQRMEITFQIGSGNPVRDLAQLPVANHEANLALYMGNGEAELTFYSDLEAKALVFQMDQVLKRRYLERVYPDISQKTIETLEAFFANNLNITEAAKQLYVHRNTLIYRLKQIKETTGYDPQFFADAVRLQLAVWISQDVTKG